MTSLHNLKNEAEKERVLKVGGQIVPHRIPAMQRLGHPVWNKNLINIGVTRSIGDFYFKDPQFVQDKQSGLIAEPDVTDDVLTTKDEFLIIASDGKQNINSNHF